MRAASTRSVARKAGWAAALAAVAGFAFSGCAEVTIHESGVKQSLPQKASLLIAGETDRARVRQLLGEPLLASDGWRFDVFRITDWNVGFVVFMWVPVLPGANKEEGYVLVSYDITGKVAAYDLGIPDNRPHYGYASAQSLRLDAADIRFVVADDSERLLVLVSPARRDVYLGGPLPGDKCLLMVRCPYGNCGEFAALEVDGVRARFLPLPMVPGGLLLPERPAAGDHHLQVFARRFMSRDAVMASGETRCEAGEAQYVIPSDYGVHGTNEPIRVTRDMPETFRDEPLLVWCDGTWLVPAEPGK